MVYQAVRNSEVTSAHGWMYTRSIQNPVMLEQGLKQPQNSVPTIPATELLLIPSSPCG